MIMPGSDYKPVIRIEGEAEVAYFAEWLNKPVTREQAKAIRKCFGAREQKSG